MTFTIVVRSFTYYIDNQPISLMVEGEFGKGDDLILLTKDDNLIQNKSWSEKGYTVLPFLDKGEFNLLIEGLRNQFIEKLHSCGVDVSSSFNPASYHQVVNHEQHIKMVNAYRNFIDGDKLPVPTRLISDRISEILGIKVTNCSKERGEFYFLRFIRPGMQDFNPPHRDVYLERIRNAVNIYVPLWGSDALSSLPMLPGSHLYKESEIERTINDGPIVNGVKFTVPCIINADKNFHFTRPNPGLNEVLIFSPYIIHGGAANFNTNTTRLSLEMRFWRAN